MELNIKTWIKFSVTPPPFDSPSPLLPYPKISFFPWTEEGERERVKILGYGYAFSLLILSALRLLSVSTVCIINYISSSLEERIATLQWGILAQLIFGLVPVRL
jgi:hypothetical protein